MSDIFISYAKEDRPLAKKFAALVSQEQEWTVFWDRTIPIGKTWREVIGKELKEAKCVVVLWSKDSIISSWVQEEADVGRIRKILVPVIIETVQPPIGFGAIQTANLSNWRGGKSNPTFRRLIDDIDATIEELVPGTAKKRKPKPDKKKTPAAKAAGGPRTKSKKKKAPVGKSAADAPLNRKPTISLKKYFPLATPNHVRIVERVSVAALLLLLVAGGFYIGRNQVGQTQFPSPEDEIKLKNADKRKRDNATWEGSKQQNTVAAYTAYLTLYPEGQNRQQAKQKIADLRKAERDKKEGTEARLKAEEQMRKRDEEAWAKATKVNTVPSYMAYQSAHRDGRYSESATQIITALKAIEKLRQAEKVAKSNAEEQMRERDKAAWAKAMQNNTIAGYTTYLSAYADGLQREQATANIAALQKAVRLKREAEEAKLRAVKEVKEARIKAEEEIRKRDEEAWAQARRTNTVTGYTTYQIINPKGSYGEQAARKIADLQKAKRVKRKAEEDRRRAEEVIRKRDDREWDRARSQNTITSYRDYLTSHADGRNRQQAVQIIAALEAAEQRRREEYSNRKAEEEKHKRDGDAWAQAKRDSTIASFKNYLKSLVDGRYRKQAEKEITALKAAEQLTREAEEAKRKAKQEILKRDDAAWQLARRKNRLNGYKNYLKAFPAGSNADNAGRKIEEIEKLPDRLMIAIYTGVDFFGNDLNDPPGRHTRNLKACWTACTKMAACNAFTFNNVRGRNKRNCFLKRLPEGFPVSGSGAVMESVQSASGYFYSRRDGEAKPISYAVIPKKLEYNVDYSGEDLGNTPHKIDERNNRVEHCRAACLTNKRCLAFTYDKRFKFDNCWLKGKIVERIAGQSRRISGRKLPELRSNAPSQIVEFGAVPARRR